MSTQKNTFISKLLLAPGLLVLIRRNFSIDGAMIEYRGFFARLVLILMQYTVEAEILWQFLQPLEIAYLRPNFIDCFSGKYFLKQCSSLENAINDINDMLDDMLGTKNSLATKPLLFTAHSADNSICQQQSPIFTAKCKLSKE